MLKHVYSCFSTSSSSYLFSFSYLNVELCSFITHVRLCPPNVKFFTKFLCIAYVRTFKCIGGEWPTFEGSVEKCGNSFDITFIYLTYSLLLPGLCAAIKCLTKTFTLSNLEDVFIQGEGTNCFGWRESISRYPQIKQ